MRDDKTIWAELLHFGTNAWKDVPRRELPENSPSWAGVADYLRFDYGVWQDATAAMAKAGMNMVVIDLSEGLEYPSHPELAVKGSWKPDRFVRELTRLRALGLEPIPKLNFSCAHDAWLGEYRRMTSTPEYYRVCGDLIRDVCDIFGKPRLFHFGFDEEVAHIQKGFRLMRIRQGELWWHDLEWIVKAIERQGVRAWCWADYAWKHREEFLRRMSRAVLLSNWYYEPRFDLEQMREDVKRQPAVRKDPPGWSYIERVTEMVETYLDLDRAGFDQLPCGSNWVRDSNFGDTVAFARKHLAPERLKGFLMTSWYITINEAKPRARILSSIDLVSQTLTRHVH